MILIVSVALEIFTTGLAADKLVRSYLSLIQEGVQAAIAYAAECGCKWIIAIPIVVAA